MQDPQEQEQTITITLSTQKAWWFGLYLNHALVFLLNHQADPAVIQSLEGLKELFHQAIVERDGLNHE